VSLDKIGRQTAIPDRSQFPRMATDAPERLDPEDVGQVIQSAVSVGGVKVIIYAAPRTGLE
jgi:hypothetical protein